jgi:hypothetical protein
LCYGFVISMMGRPQCKSLKHIPPLMRNVEIFPNIWCISHHCWLTSYFIVNMWKCSSSLNCPVHILQVCLLTCDFLCVYVRTCVCVTIGCQGFETVNVGVALFMLLEVVTVETLK